jgi:hypothetical protein
LGNLFGGRRTNFSFPHQRGSAQFWAKVGVDSTFQEGISYPSIKHWVQVAIDYAERIGIPNDEPIIARLGWDATDILRYLSHNTKYEFSGDHNGSAPFLEHGLTLPDTLPDPAPLQELFRVVMVQLDHCKRGRCECQGVCTCGQSGRCTPQQMLKSLQAASSFASEHLAEVDTEKKRLEKKAWMRGTNNCSVHGSCTPRCWATACTLWQVNKPLTLESVLVCGTIETRW